MKKLTLLLSAIIFSLALAFPAWAQEANNDAENQPEVKLTDEQKQELEKLHTDLLEKKKEMIDKHVEFGVLPKEKGEKIKEMLDKKFEEMKANGFIPMYHKHKHCHDKDDKDDNDD